jgi:hypothetical protein
MGEPRIGVNEQIPDSEMGKSLTTRRSHAAIGAWFTITRE